jgi:hypothetical protein
MNTASVRKNQAPLRTQYQSSAQAAQISDHARTAGIDPDDPFHSSVEPMPGSGVSIPVGVHRAVGGCTMAQHLAIFCAQLWLPARTPACGWSPISLALRWNT